MRATAGRTRLAILPKPHPHQPWLWTCQAGQRQLDRMVHRERPPARIESDLTYCVLPALATNTQGPV